MLLLGRDLRAHTVDLLLQLRDFLIEPRELIARRVAAACAERLALREQSHAFLLQPRQLIGDFRDFVVAGRDLLRNFIRALPGGRRSILRLRESYAERGYKNTHSEQSLHCSISNQL